MTGRRAASGQNGVKRAPSLQDRLRDSSRPSSAASTASSTATPFKTAAKHPIDVTPGPSTQQNLRVDTFHTPGGKFVERIDDACQELVDDYLKKAQHKSAIFWARKRLTIREARSSDTPIADKAEYLRTLCACQEWQRLVAFIECYKLYREHIVFVYFYFSGLYNLKRFQDVLSFHMGHLIEFPDVPSSTTETEQHIYWSRVDRQSAEDKAKLQEIYESIDLIPSLLTVLGKTYGIMQNRKAAGSCFRLCLEYDPFNVDAVQELLRHKLQSKTEIRQIVSKTVEKLPRPLSPAQVQLFEMVELLVDDPGFTESDEDVSEIKKAYLVCPTTKAAEAFELFKRGEINEAYRITYDLMKEEGAVGLGLLVHLGTLVQLRRKEELFTFSHKLVEMNPENEVAWYAVGCYFHIIEDRRDAKQYLDKCTSMNPSFGEAWIMFGHILTSESEHEHALNCYQRAARLLEHAFEPQLYIGLEHSYANNISVASGHLTEAAKISGRHPIVIQEQAVLLYGQERYAEAYKLLIEALRRITGWEKDNLSQLLSYKYDMFWEPLIQNLGHVARRLGHYDDAIECHKKSLLMSPKNSEALSALSLCYACKGDVESAITYVHEALVQKPRDQILKQCLDDYMTDSQSQDVDELLYAPVDHSQDLDMTSVSEMLQQLRAEMDNVSTKRPPLNFSQERPAASEKREPRRSTSQRSSTGRSGYNTRSQAKAAASNDQEEMET